VSRHCKPVYPPPRPSSVLHCATPPPCRAAAAARPSSSTALPVAGLCLLGKRRSNFASPLSSKAVCLLTFPTMLERFTRKHINEWRGKFDFTLAVEFKVAWLVPQPATPQMPPPQIVDCSVVTLLHGVSVVVVARCGRHPNNPSVLVAVGCPSGKPETTGLTCSVVAC
jgi:hypothetical protein